jgi:predicted nucleic-acid-binding Zn-ribbon protein
MVFVWVGIGIGILAVTVLVVKIIKSPRNSFITLRCKKCGLKTNGLKCLLCESEKKAI